MMILLVDAGGLFGDFIDDAPRNAAGWMMFNLGPSMERGWRELV